MGQEILSASRIFQTFDSIYDFTNKYKWFFVYMKSDGCHFIRTKNQEILSKISGKIRKVS